MKSLAIIGGAGRMGQAMAAGLGERGDFKITALVDVATPRDLFGATFFSKLSDIDPSTVDVVIEFSSPESVVSSATWCAANKVGLVIGTTGLSSEQRNSIEEAGKKTGVLIASNFSLGAVLSERFAAIAAPYFDRVEIIELHHDKKVDAPSGTSITTAQAIADSRKNAKKPAIADVTERETFAGSRGADVVDGVRIHSIRLPGLVAHQEVLFGGPGEGLTIRHDSFDRTSFVQGVAIAANAIGATPCFVTGIDSLL
jgi:4-hydroxy-tetrahydrodipicolinate reductase